MDEKIILFMINSIAQTQIRIEEELRGISKKRFFLNELEKALSESGQRLFIISGLRGTGKTTALYQIIQENEKENSVYLSCDEIISREISLEQSIEALDFIKKENIGMKKKFLLLLDEITYLPDWDTKLKILRDKRPNLFIIATSSSSLPLRKTVEFARRAYEITVYPFSFREFLLLKHNILVSDELSASLRGKILSGQGLEQDYVKVISSLRNYNLSALYEDYMRHDLPFALTLSDNAYAIGVNEIIKRTIYEDFLKYANFETELLTAAEKMIKYLSTIPADGVKITKISEVVSISKESVVKLLDMFELALIIKGLEHAGRNRMLKKPKKWFFYSPSMRYVLSVPISNPSEITGNLREDSVFRHLIELNEALYYGHEADFVTDKLRIEVGKGKKFRKDTLMLDADDILKKGQMPIALFALCV